jgi:glutathione S-transferase
MNVNACYYFKTGAVVGRATLLTGDAISLADLLVAPQVCFLTETPEWSVLNGAHENLVAWLTWVEARPMRFAFGCLHNRNP